MQVRALVAYEPAIEADEERWRTPPASPVRSLVLRGVPREFLWRVLMLLLEALEGKRALAQLHGILPAETYEAMLTRRRGPRARYRLMRVHTCEVSAGVVEVAAVVRIMPEVGKWWVRVMAGRVERESGEWRWRVLRLVGL
ncbi:Rv3235 family protein [Actinokineospora inagensis]|uniref:Rv3235 family protein n=1 Tax=Actinokineospora inagensis TaxID=103730 RepID=UPI00040CC3AF|nr:Rv3235 family protein [Actinokineospora inagensis]